MRSNSKAHYDKHSKGSPVLTNCFGCFEDKVISLSRWIFMKEVVLPWILKDILDLMDRKGDMVEEHFRRREQTSLSKGVGSRELMACLGVMNTPLGLECGIF